MDYTWMIPISAFLLVQTGTLVWFLATLNNKVANLIEQVKIINQVYVTEKDMTEKHKRIHMRIDETEKDITRIEKTCNANHQAKK